MARQIVLALLGAAALALAAAPAPAQAAPVCTPLPAVGVIAIVTVRAATGACADPTDPQPWASTATAACATSIFAGGCAAVRTADLADAAAPAVLHVASVAVCYADFLGNFVCQDVTHTLP